MNLLNESVKAQKNNRRTKELNKLIDKVNFINCVDIRIKGRERDVIYAKKMYFHIAYCRGYSLHSISRTLNMSHATVIHHKNDTEWLLENDEHFKANYLRCQGKPVEGKCTRDYFDLMIAQHTQKGFEI